MSDALKPYQVLHRFVRDHKGRAEPVTIAGDDLAKLVGAIEQALITVDSTGDLIRARFGLGPYVPTYEDKYGEPEPA